MNEQLVQFLKDNRIHEVECVIPDMTGIARGKIVPRNLFLAEESMKMSKAVLNITVNGEFAEFERFAGASDPDMVCVPDANTVRMVPWALESVAVVIHDCQDFDGRPVALSPRAVLRRVLRAYESKGWRPVVAPEMEFYLIAQNNNPHEPLRPPVGRNGRTETGRQSFSIDAVNDFDPFFQELSAFCEAANLGVETLIHEVGAGQMEINFSHGDALDLADRVFLFKRAVRETAYRHKIFATFMAKPMQDEPGSAMHIHQSIVDSKTGKNIFSKEDGTATDLLFTHCRHAEIHAQGDADVRTLRQFLSSSGQKHGGADQCLLGLRQPHLRHPHSQFRPTGAPPRKPCARRGCESVSGDGGNTRLRLSGHGGKPRSIGTADGFRLR